MSKEVGAGGRFDIFLDSGLHNTVFIRKHFHTIYNENITFDLFYSCFAFRMT